MTETDLRCKEAVARYLYFCQKSGKPPTGKGYIRWRNSGPEITEGSVPSKAAIQAHLGPWTELVKVLGDPAVMRTLVYMPD